MRVAAPQSASRWADRAGIVLSLTCAVHCAVGGLLIAALAGTGSLLGGHDVHRVGLAVALVIGIASLAGGSFRQAPRATLIVGGVGLAIMALALTIPHDAQPWETTLTLIGAGLLALAHILKLRGGVARG